jgi:hypothetical protein
MRVRCDHEMRIGRNYEGCGRSVPPPQQRITTEDCNQKSWDCGQDRSMIPPKSCSYLIAKSALTHTFIPLGTKTTNSALVLLFREQVCVLGLLINKINVQPAVLEF